MKNGEYYKDYIASFRSNISDFTVFEKFKKLNKFLHITRESEDRFLQSKLNISTSHNFIKDCLAWVCFKEVEIPLTKIFVENEILGSGALAKGVFHPTLSIYGHHSFHPFERKPHYFKVKKITTKQEAELETQMLLDYWNMLVIPFFNYFTHLHNLIPYIEDNSQIIKTLNPIGCYQRKLMIWYLCGHPQYKNYKEDIINMVTSYKEDWESQRWTNATMQVIEHVEKREPLYSWEEAFLVPKPIPSITKEFNLNNYELPVQNKELGKWNISRLWKGKKP